jgi:serine/threonine-protein kinase
VSRGSLDGLGETFEKGEPTAAPKEEVADARSLPEDEGLGSSAKADTGSLKLVGLNLPSGDPVLREEGAVDQDPKAGVPVEPGTEVNTAAGSGPERVSVPEVSGGSAEEASHTLSEAGLVEAGTATRHSSELAGTVIGTEPSMGSTVKRGAAVSIVVSSGSPSQKASNGAEDAAHATVREETSVPTQPSKSRKPDQKPSK